jgi:hypothetical protein
MEESVEVRTDSSGLAGGSWLFIAVADDDEQRVTLLWIEKREERD